MQNGQTSVEGKCSKSGEYLQIYMSIARWSMRLVLGFTFGASAFAKSFWGTSPYTIYGVFVGGHPTLHRFVIAMEFALALWVLIGWQTAWAGRATIVVLILLSSVLAWELTKKTPLLCGCFSSTDAGRQMVADTRQSLIWGLLRNFVLLSAAMWLAVRRPAGCHSRDI